MKNPFKINNNIPWSESFIGKNTNPVYRHATSPSRWEATGSRVIFNYYGEGKAIDIRIMETDSDFQHQVNITVDEDGRLKAIVSEQTK